MKKLIFYEAPERSLHPQYAGHRTCRGQRILILAEREEGNLFLTPEECQNQGAKFSRPGNTARAGKLTLGIRSLSIYAYLM